jgi:hypothetical protein
MLKIIRFLNVDYAVFDALWSCLLECVAFSYDIYCKWHIHAEKRACEHFPPEMVANFLRMQRRGFVPKLHLYAHGALCQTTWSLNYHQGVGRTDGESTERDWAAVVVAALQTAEMNHGSRHAALDNHWIDKNFRREVGLSKKFYPHFPSLSLNAFAENLLLKWFQNAVKWSKIQTDSANDLANALDPAMVCQWKDMVKAWQSDKSKPNPYEEREEGQCYTCLSSQVLTIGPADAVKTLHAKFAEEDKMMQVQATSLGLTSTDLPSLALFAKMGQDLRLRQ